MNDDHALLVNVPAPWSPLARDELTSGDRALKGLASTSAQHRLASEIERYARGEASGRSFLVAGHRGAGKTTAVLAAMQQVYNACRRGDDPKLSGSRPLFVRLHAPSLLVEQDESSKPPDKAAAPGTETPAGAAGAAKAETRATRRSTRFLEEMAAGIFPALVDELRRLLLLSPHVDTGATFAAASSLDARQIQNREMVAHLCDELSRGISLAELRELFRRLNLLPRGLLRNVDAYQELVAIHAASEAYLIVTGKFEEEQNTNRGASQSDKNVLSHTFDGEKLVKSLTPAFAAASVAFGVSTGHPEAGAVIAAGVLLSGLTFSFTSTRERSRSAAASRSFKRDTTHESLIRRVPLLVEQLREVGFPVVFVLDELDKLEGDGPEELLRRLMRDLKSYVTERSFICFLADRDYYEKVFRVRPAEDGDPAQARPRYGIEHTFFSHSTYVVLTHAALHAYLRVALGETQPSLETDAASTTRTRQRQLRLAKLRLVLLGRAKLHGYDLQRELGKALASGDLKSIDSGGVDYRAPVAWVYASIIELAIEWVMCEARRRARAAEDPFFAQLEQELLYEIADAWRLSERVETSDEALRTNAASRTRRIADQTLLVEAVRELISILRAPRTFTALVDQELDLERVRRFLLDGEEEPLKADVDNADVKNDRGRDRHVLKQCFATRKYQVLRDVTGTFAEPLLGQNQGEWLVDSAGYSARDAGQNPEAAARIHELLKFKEELEERKIEVEFEELWDALAGLELKFGQLVSARLAAQARPSDPSARLSIARFAEVAPDLCRAMAITIAGLHLLEAAHPDKKSAALSPRSLFLGAIHGDSARSRTDSVAKLVQELASLYRAPLSPRLLDLLSPEDLGDKVYVEARLIDQADLPVPQAVAARDDIRARWESSLALRISTGMRDGRAVDSEAEQAGRLLDLVAALADWFPDALLDLWVSYPQPREWTIKMLGRLLTNPTSRDGRPLAWLPAFAAVRLGLASTAKTNLATARAVSRSEAVEELLAWVEAACDALPKGTLQILLLDPGDVMGQWLPDPNYAVLPRSTAAGARLDDASSFDFIVAEGDAPPPTMDDPRPFAAVVPVPETRSAERFHRGKHGVVLLGPSSVAQAVEWFLDASPG